MRTLLVLLALAFPAAAQEQSKDVQQLVREGVSLFDSGRFEEAIANYEEALQLEPDNVNARYELALTYAQTGAFGMEIGRRRSRPIERR